MDIKKIKGLSELSTPEKILLLEDLWNSITLKESEVPVPDSHKQELDRRLKKYKSDPGKLLSLEELQNNINRKI